MTDIDWETHESRVQHVRRELLAIGRLIEDLPPGEDRTARQVAWDENQSEFGYRDPRGGRALLELAPVPSWHELQYRR